MKKFIIATASSVMALGLMTACSDSGSSAPVTVTETPAPVTETVTEKAEATADETATKDAAAPASKDQKEQRGVERPKDVPSSVSSYSTEAEREMTEEGLTEADVDSVVKAAVDGEARVDWDRDGYFELEHQGIDIDVTPEGKVLDVSR